MCCWWKLAWNSGTRSIWFLLFNRTSLSVAILDMDPRAFIFLSVIVGTIDQNNQGVLSLYLNQCQVVSCQPEPTAKSEVRSIIIQLVHSVHFNKSTYPCRQIDLRILLVLFCPIAFHQVFWWNFITFYLLWCIILLPMLGYADALLEQQKGIKTVWLDIHHDS